MAKRGRKAGGKNSAIRYVLYKVNEDKSISEIGRYTTFKDMLEITGASCSTMLMRMLIENQTSKPKKPFKWDGYFHSRFLLKRIEEVENQVTASE